MLELPEHEEKWPWSWYQGLADEATPKWCSNATTPDYGAAEVFWNCAVLLIEAGHVDHAMGYVRDFVRIRILGL